MNSTVTQRPPAAHALDTARVSLALGVVALLAIAWLVASTIFTEPTSAAPWIALNAAGLGVVLAPRLAGAVDRREVLVVAGLAAVILTVVAALAFTLALAPLRTDNVLAAIVGALLALGLCTLLGAPASARTPAATATPASTRAPEPSPRGTFVSAAASVMPSTPTLMPEAFAGESPLGEDALEIQCAPGVRIGRYKLEQRIAVGGMGEVWRARHDTLIRPAVLKLVKRRDNTDAGAIDELMERFRREAITTANLTSPHTVHLYDFGVEGRTFYIAMELLEAVSIAALVERFGPLEEARVAFLLRQACHSLIEAHDHGVVHRDIKPANILIARDGKIKIADFGIAKIDSSLLTQAGTVMGTPTYMPPEQFMGAEVDRRADIYSTGVILYQFLTGLRPFTGGVISVMHQAINQEPTPPSHINPNVPVELDEVVKKAMAKKPEDRYQDVAEFMAALKLAARALPSSPGSAATRPGPRPEFGPEGTIRLADRTAEMEAARRNDIASWQRISDSLDIEDFQRYLRDHPEGEFAELARRRIASLTEATKQARLLKEARMRAEKEAHIRKKAEQQAAAEKAQAEARARAEAEAKRRREAEEKERWALKLAEIRSEAERARAEEAAKREGEQQELSRQARAQELSASLSRHPHQFVEVVSRREAAVEAERRMLKEQKKKLEEEMRRKQEAKQKLLSRKEAMETRMTAAAEENQQQQAVLAERNRELEEARQRIEAAERRRKEAEALAAQAQKRTRRMIYAAALLSALLLGGLLLLLR